MDELIAECDLVAFPPLDLFFSPENPRFTLESFKDFTGDISDSTIFVGTPLQAINKLKIQSKSFDLIIFKPDILQVVLTEKKSDIKDIQRYYTEYFEMLRQLLSDEGSLYVDLENLKFGHLIKDSLDKVFGEDNKINEILVRAEIPNFLKNQKEKRFQNSGHGIILFYSKNKNYIWNEQKQILSDRELSKKYPHADAQGQYRLMPLHVPGIRKGATGQPWRNISPPEGKHWRYDLSKLDKLDESGLIHWSKTGNPRLKEYLNLDKEMTTYQDYWDLSAPTYALTYEKAKKMYEVLIRSTTNEDSKILNITSYKALPLLIAKDLNLKWNAITYDVNSLFSLMYNLKKEFFLDSSVKAIATKKFIESEFDPHQSQYIYSLASLSDPSRFFNK